MFFEYGKFLSFLRGQGYFGPVNEALKKFLIAQGVSDGQLNEMLYGFLGDLGYTGSLAQRMEQWENADFLVSVDPISAVVEPDLQTLTEGETPADGLAASATNTGNYASTEGTIDSAVAEANINSGGFSEAAMSTTLSANDIVQVRVTVTDDDTPENSRVFNAGTETVIGVPAQMSAPTVTAVTGVNGEEISVSRATAPSANGSPITSYDLRWDTDSGMGTATTVTDIIAVGEIIDSLTAGTEYFVQTRANNAVGNGPWSSNGSATTTVAAPTNNAAPSISASVVVGETNTVTPATFNGGTPDTTVTSIYVSDDGSTGWTLVTTGTTVPSKTIDKYYSAITVASNDGGSATSARSNVIGPVVAPVLTLNGLTTDASLAIDIAEIGDEASITFTPDQGTVTAREWGSFENGSNMGTGSNPTSMAAFNGGTLWAEATIGGVQYRDTAPIYYPHPTLGSSLINQSFAKDNGVQTYATASGFTFSGTRAYEIVSAPTGVTVNSSGQVSFDTDVLETQSLTNITVRMKDAVNEARYVDASFSLTITDSSIVLSNYSENLAADPPTFSFDVTAAGNNETYFWEFHNTSTPPGRGNGFHASGSEGTVSTGSNNKQPDLRAEFGNTGYLHHSVGASGASNVLTSAQFTVPTSAPAAFPDAAWDLTDADEGGKLTATFTAGPTTYGTSVTDTEYEVGDSGTWVATGLSSFPGSFDITTTNGSTPLTNGVEYSVKVRARSSDGAGDESNAKLQTPTAGVPAAPTAWTVTNEGSGGTVEFNVSSHPANNGATITDYLYTTDAGANWNSIGGADTGVDYPISVQSDGSTALVDDTEYTVALRAVNSAGDGAISTNKTVTPTTVGGGTIPPTFIGADSDGINSASSTTDVNAPTWAAGDEVFVFCDWSCGVNVLGTVTITDLSNGDTINTVISPTGTGDGNGGHSAALYRFRATGSGGGTNAIRIAHSGNTTSIQGLPFVVRGADATNPVAHASSATANGASPAAPAMVVTNENCLVVHCVAAQFDMADDSTPTGYTLQESHDVGALGAVLYTRDTETSASESVASENYTLPGAQDWVAISFVVQPDGV